jgi:hypothetical protein
VKRAVVAGFGCLLLTWSLAAQSARSGVGQELAVARHLTDGDEFKMSAAALVSYGRTLFEANWTELDGAGRPLSKGTGGALSDRAHPLEGARAYNRISGPDANSCQGCHNLPYGITGGGGDFVTNAFQLADRFDFITFERTDDKPTSGTVDERRRPASLQTVGNVRATPGLFGAGYIEMLARQITEDLQRTRDSIHPGESKPLMSKGIPFGVLARDADGRWNVSGVQGLAEPSVLTSATRRKPSLLVRPWQQSGHGVSLREVTNDSFNRHHGIQTTERFGVGTDPDGDGVVNEMTRADVTAVTVFQASLAVPGRVIPNNPSIERAVSAGERVFEQIRCTTCHLPSIPLDRRGWIYSEPGPNNPPMNLRRGDARVLEIDLTSAALPSPRLLPSSDAPSVIHVPAYTDFKLHDITDPKDETAKEPLDMNQLPGSPKFLDGNRKFLTRRLWGVANEPPYFHDGRFTTMRQAVMAHAGEALEQRRAFEQLAPYEQDALIEFLKSLQVLPPGTKDLYVDEHFRPKAWRSFGQTESRLSPLR